MTHAHTWTGRRGPVVLGSTEHRVALGLDHLTRHGAVRIRTVDLMERFQLERSEAYRITRRLRILGLFGIRNDPSGSAGGRLWWRTAAAHDGAELDPDRHLEAVRRIRGWARTAAATMAAWLEWIRAARVLTAHAAADAAPEVSPPPREPFPLRRLMLELAPELAREWRL